MLEGFIFIPALNLQDVVKRSIMNKKNFEPLDRPWKLMQGLIFPSSNRSSPLHVEGFLRGLPPRVIARAIAGGDKSLGKICQQKG
jgi:hypothetical protein